MEKTQFVLTQDAIMEVIGPMNAEGFQRLRELLVKQGDTAFESFIHTLENLIGLHI